VNSVIKKKKSSDDDRSESKVTRRIKKILELYPKEKISTRNRVNS
jgi:hypothetical protein